MMRGASDKLNFKLGIRELTHDVYVLTIVPLFLVEITESSGSNIQKKL